MGDDLHTNVWEDEVDVGQLINEDRLDVDDYELIEDENSTDIMATGNKNAAEEDEKRLKKEKRKSKFEKLKENKRLKVANSDIEASEEEKRTKLRDETALTTAASGHHSRGISSDEQMKLLLAHAPGDLPLKDTLSLNKFYDMGGMISKATNQNHPPSPSKILVQVVQTIHASSSSSVSRVRGSPRVILVCSSAIRSVQVIALLSKSMKCKIGKMFAKHFKITEQIEALQKTYYPIIVGTPHRILKLIELGALGLEECKAVLLDMALDSKDFSLLTLPAVHADVYRFIDMVSRKEEIKLALI